MRAGWVIKFVSFVKFIESNKRGDINVNDGAWCIEREKANSTMGEPEIMRRAGVRIDGNGITSNVCCRDWALGGRSVLFGGESTSRRVRLQVPFSKRGGMRLSRRLEGDRHAIFANKSATCSSVETRP